MSDDNPRCAFDGVPMQAISGYEDPGHWCPCCGTLLYEDGHTERPTLALEHSKRQLEDAKLKVADAVAPRAFHEVMFPSVKLPPRR